LSEEDHVHRHPTAGCRGTSRRSPQSGRCLDSRGGATADGTDLQIYDCNGTDAQKWKVPV